MLKERASGLLLHPTSLPGNYGIGDFGKEAFNFVNFLSVSGFKFWQVLPLTPTGFGDSPYSGFSAFAGNPLLINLDILVEEKLLNRIELSEYNFLPNQVDYEKVSKFKNTMLRKAFQNFILEEDYFTKFCTKNNFWLDDYALFMATKLFYKGKAWNEWDKDIAFRNSAAIIVWEKKLKEEILYQKFLQYIFYKQWHSLKLYANGNGIKIIGDIPIFISYDSADVWANPNLFEIDKNGKAKFVAGVPPDYFSSTGQLWGNPIYKWDSMLKDNFAWWKKRFKHSLDLCDMLRVDHFRGFESYYKIVGDAKDATKGIWEKAPGHKLFNSLLEEFGSLPFIAEDLGTITPEVTELRDKFGFPGMKIIQFGLGEWGDKSFLPHRYEHNCVVYTGTHDNDTTRGFIEAEKAKDNGLVELAAKYFNCNENDLVWEIIRSSFASSANLVIIPMQDMLNLGTSSRMNIPSSSNGNWRWRFTWDQVEPKLSEKYKEICELYER